MAMQSWHGTVQALAADLIFQETEIDNDITLSQKDFFCFYTSTTIISPASLMKHSSLFA